MTQLDRPKKRGKYRKELKPRKPGGGRKPLPDQTLRTVQFGISLPRAQYEHIKSIAEAEATTISEVLRTHFLPDINSN